MQSSVGSKAKEVEKDFVCELLGVLLVFRIEHV